MQIGSLVHLRVMVFHVVEERRKIDCAPQSKLIRRCTEFESSTVATLLNCKSVIAEPPMPQGLEAPRGVLIYASLEYKNWYIRRL